MLFSHITFLLPVDYLKEHGIRVLHVISFVRTHNRIIGDRVDNHLTRNRAAVQRIRKRHDRRQENRVNRKERLGPEIHRATIPSQTW